MIHDSFFLLTWRGPRFNSKKVLPRGYLRVCGRRRKHHAHMRQRRSEILLRLLSVLLAHTRKAKNRERWDAACSWYISQVAPTVITFEIIVLCSGVSGAITHSHSRHIRPPPYAFAMNSGWGPTTNTAISLSLLSRAAHILYIIVYVLRGAWVRSNIIMCLFDTHGGSRNCDKMRRRRMENVIGRPPAASSFMSSRRQPIIKKRRAPALFSAINFMDCVYLRIYIYWAAPATWVYSWFVISEARI